MHERHLLSDNFMCNAVSQALQGCSLSNTAELFKDLFALRSGPMDVLASNSTIPTDLV